MWMACVRSATGSRKRRGTRIDPVSAALIFGILVGLSLGLTGGGGSIFAVPLLIYGLGLPLRDAVTVSLAVVGATALFGAVLQGRRPGLVLWGAGAMLGLGGIIGAPLGAKIGMRLPESLTLLLFAGLMLVIGARMLKSGSSPAEIPLSWATCARGEHGLPRFTPTCGGKLVAAGAFTGILSGIFGVGGGFLVVPALMFVTGVSIERALATSLVGIALISGAAFAANVFFEVRSLPPGLTVVFLVGALGGMIAGSRLKHHLPSTALRRIFAVSVIALAVIIAAKTLFFS